MVSNLKCFDIANQITQNTLTNSNLGNDTIVIGADTIVSYSDQILGKPADAQNAFEMLKSGGFIYIGRAITDVFG